MNRRISLLNELQRKFPKGPRREALERVGKEVFGQGFDGDLENLTVEELEKLSRAADQRIPNTPDAVFTGAF